MSTLVRKDYTRCKVSARIRADLVQAACTKTVSQIQVSGCKKHVCGRHRCAKRPTGLVFYRLTCTSSAVGTVPKWALETVLRPKEPPFVWRLYEKTALRGSESTPCTNRCKPDTSKFKVFQVPGLRSTVRCRWRALPVAACRRAANYVTVAVNFLTLYPSAAPVRAKIS